MTRKMKRYNEGELVGEAVGDSNEGMKETRDAYDASQAEEANKAKEAAEANKAKEAAEDMRERAKAEGARDAGKITESGDQGFGGSSSSRTVKATPKAPSKPKADPKPAAKTESAPAAKAAPAAKLASSSRVPTSEQAAANRSAAMDKIKSVGSSIGNYFSSLKTPAERRAQERKMEKLKADPTSRERDFASGGMTSSASKRADGIATKGKTRGKMC